MAAGRYEGSDVAEVRVPDGLGGIRTVRYLRRRRLLDPREVPAMATHRINADDRLDLVAARYLGDSLAAWQVTDANTAMDPDELTEPGTTGNLLVIPFPQAAP